MGHAEIEEREATGAIEAANQRARMRAGSSGAIPTNALVIARQQADEMLELEAPAAEGFAPRDAGIGAWEWLGPGNVGGRIRSIVIHPTTPQNMWVGGVGGGIWKTTDGGLNWSNINDFMASLAVSSMVLDPTTPATMYAATGEILYSGSGQPGAGIFKSTNGGATWTQLAATAGWTFVTRLAHHPSSSGTLFACTQQGVQRTNNGGTSWTLVLPGVNAYDIRINPANSAQVLVGTQNATDSNGNPLYGGVFYSGSSGNAGTWVDQSAALPPPNQANSRMPALSGPCEVTWGSGSTMWVSAARNNGEVWRSTDAGLNWTLRNTGTQYITQAGTHAIWAAPDNANLVVIGGLDLWRSTDAGQNFTRISDWTKYHTNESAHADQHIIINPPDYNTNSRRVYVGNDGGIQMAQNIFTTTTTTGWSRLVSGLGITQFYGGAVYPGADRIYGGTQDNSTLRLHYGQGPDAWYQATTGDGTYCAVVPGLPLIAYTAFQNLDLRKSTNGGDSYVKKQEGLEDAVSNPPRTLFIAPFVIDPNDHQILVAGGQTIYRTTDGADFWNSIRAPITYTNTATPPVTVTQLCSAMEVAPGNSQNIWVGYDNGTVSRTDGLNVTNWTDVHTNGTTPIPAGGYVTDIAINPLNNSEVFVTIGGYATNTVWFTADNGGSWTNRNGPPPPVGGPSHQLPAVQVNTIRFHPHKPNYVYVGTDLGIFASQDKGLSWNRAPSNGIGHDAPANVEVDELFWDYDVLYAATHGRGMYRTRPVVTDCLAWTQLAPSASPADRYSHAMVYDSARQVVVMFGGGLPQYGDTWEFDGTNWVNRGVSGPAPRSGHAMAYDPVRQKTLLFGGRDGDTFFNDTWEWDGNTWTQRTSTLSPDPRYLHAMSYDAPNDRIVLYGGSNDSAGYTDTWEWYPTVNGGDWGLSNDGTDGPIPRPGHVQGHAMAYNPATQRVTMVGGTSQNFLINTGETFEWNGVAQHWVRVGVAPVSPFRPTMAFDATRNLLRFYGGQDSDGRFLDATYEWDGANWIIVGNGTPPGRADPVMVYDSARDKTILFGGRTDPDTGRFGDTWALQTSRPNITSQPQCTTARAGQPITLSVTATGSEPLTYQWHRVGVGDLGDDGRIAGSLTATLTINPTQVADTGDYRVSVSDRCNGTTDSATVRVVIHAPLTGGSQVTAFGQNSFGQLGRGTICSGSNCDTRMREVNAIGNVVQVSGNVYGFHVLALHANGTVSAWGANSYGQIGNGTLSTPPNVLQPHTVAGLTDVIAVAAGGEFSLALKSDGTVWGWGQNWSGALGNATTPLAAIGTPIQIPGLSCVIAIGATKETSFALKSDGSVWSWGANGFGQLGIGSMTPVQTKAPQPVLNLGSGVVELSCGMGHVLARKSDGTVWSWGYNNAGQTGDGLLTHRNTPLQVPGLFDIVKVAAGWSFSLALRNDGVAMSWGYNASGELGRGHFTSPMLTPAPVITSSGLTSVSDLAAGNNHSVFLRPDGTVWTTGLGAAETGYPTPQPADIGKPKHVTRILFPCVSVDTAYQSTLVRHAPTPPYYDLQPLSQTCLVGGLLRLKTDPYGTPVLNHIWVRNGNDLFDNERVAGAWSPNLTIDPVIPSDAGQYHLNTTNLQAISNSDQVSVGVVASPFCDEFTTGASTYWGHEYGAWSASGGAYRAAGNTYSSLPFELADFVMDVDIINMQTGAIWLRSSGTPPWALNGVQLSHTAGRLEWFYCINGSCPGPFNPVYGAYTVGANVRLRIEVTGNTYKVFVNGAATPATQYTYAGYASGRVALNDYSGPGQAYDAVCVMTDDGLPPDGDMNGDGAANGDDIAPFVAAAFAGAIDPMLLDHGDFNGNGIMDAGDAPGFVQELLNP